MDDYLDVPVTAADIRPADRLVRADGVTQVVVSAVERHGQIWIDSAYLQGAQPHRPDEPIVLRCPTVRGGGYSYFAETQPDGTVVVYRHVGKGEFAAVLASYPATTET